jgi:hypothetical protein
MTLTLIDREALVRAMELARRDDLPRRQQLDSKLADGEPWQEVAEFAAYCVQHETLRTKPWEVAPCSIQPEDIAELVHIPPPDMSGHGKAARLLQRLLELGLSRWEPEPERAIAAAERRASSAGSRRC